MFEYLSPEVSQEAEVVTPPELLLVGYNPASSASMGLVNKLAKSSEELSVPVNFFEVSIDPLETATIVHNKLDEDLPAWLLLVGGDGTPAGSWLPIQQDPDIPESLVNLPVGLLGGGGLGENLKKASMGKRRVSLSKILDRGRIVEIFPNELNIRTEDDKETKRHFLTVAGVGATAAAAAAINQEGNRQKFVRRRFGKLGRIVADGPVVASEIIKAKDFNIYDEFDKQKSLRELIFLNASEVAHLIRSPHITLEDNPHNLEIGGSRNQVFWLGKIALTLGKLRLGGIAPSLSPSERLLSDYTFVNGDNPLPYQIDGEDKIGGEALMLPPNSEVTVRQSKTPLKLLATRKPLG